jgi:hypothetical protein
MEGVVAKQASAKYRPEATTWVKIKNRQYSQAVGREEFSTVRVNTAPGEPFSRSLTWSGLLVGDVAACVLYTIADRFLCEYPGRCST